MTLEQFIKDLQQELDANPEMKDKEVTFHTSGNFDLSYLSIYETKTKVNFDIG